MTDKLLAINFGGIGDEILFLPVLESIRKANPSIHITLLLEPRSKAIGDITNLVDDIKLFDIKKRPLLPNDYFDLLQILRSGNYTTVVSSGGSPLVACLLFASGIKERIGYDSGSLSRLLLSQAVRLDKNQYAADMYHDLVQGMGLIKKQVVPHINVPEASLVRMRDYLSNFGKPEKEKRTKRIIIHPGTSRLAIEKGIIKTWTASNWANLIEQLTSKDDMQLILAGGPDDEQTILQIKEELDNKSFSSALFISAYGATKSLADLSALISISDLLICVDSAPMHVAVGVKKPILALFGPTDPAKLLPSSPQWRYLKDSVAAIDSAKCSTGNQKSYGINVQPDAVYHCAMDLLQLVKVQ